MKPEPSRASGWGLETEKRARFLDRQGFGSREHSIRAIPPSVAEHGLPSLGIELARLSDSQKSELIALLQERDPEIFLKSAFVFGKRLEAAGASHLASRWYGALIEAGLAPELARSQLEALNGKGSFGTKAEALGTLFLKEATNPKLLLPMVAGNLAGTFAKTITASRLAQAAPSWWTRGAIAGKGASLAGYLFEVPVFAGAHCALSAHALPFADSLKRAAVTLGVLKVAGGNSPLRVYGALLLANRVETKLGWRSEADRASTLVETLGTMISLSAGANLATRILGPRWTQFHRDIAARSVNARQDFSWEGMILSFQAAGARSTDARPRTFSNFASKPMLMSASGAPPPPRSRGESVESTALVRVNCQGLARRSRGWVGRSWKNAGRLWQRVRLWWWRVWNPSEDEFVPLRALRKERRWQIEGVSDSTYRQYVQLANGRSWPLGMVMARVLKFAPMAEVEPWIERLFPKRLDLAIHWIHQGKIRGGSKWVIDAFESLQRAPFHYRGRMLLDAIRELKVTDALPLLYSIMQDPGKNPYRMDIFQTILRLENVDVALKYLDEKLQEDWLSPKIDYWSDSSQNWRQVLPLRIELNWEKNRDHEAALRAILQGQTWEEALRQGRAYDSGRKILRNFPLLLRMGSEEPKILTDLYSHFRISEDMLRAERVQLVEALLNQGHIDLVRETLKSYRDKIQGEFQYGYQEEARVLAQAGDTEAAFEYFRHVLERPGRGDKDRFHVLEALVRLGETEWALGLAEDLLKSSEVAIQAADLMDFIQSGWDQFLRQPPPLTDPYR